jgi:outer membrane protein TolC
VGPSRRGRKLLSVLAAAIVAAALSPGGPEAAGAQVADVGPGADLAQASVLDRYVAQALEANLSLQGRSVAAEQASTRWTESRRAYLPSVQLEGRFTRADGGRAFVLPIGDLINPVYGALEELNAARGQTSNFPALANERIDFIRPQEQETRLRVTQLLFNPAVGADVRRTRSEAEAAVAGLAAERARVIRDVKTAYYRYVNATRSVDILSAAVAMVAENERSNQALWEASQITRDQVHRARAERLEVEQQRDRAVTEQAVAASHLNYLLARDPGAPLEVDEADLVVPDDAGAFRFRAVSAVVDPDARPVDRDDVEAVVAQVPMRSLMARATRARPELLELDLALEAAEAGVSAARGSTLPTVALAVDAGIQGVTYGFGPEDRYVMASLIFNWNVTQGGAERARIHAASLERDRLLLVREDAERRIRLEVESAALRAQVALTSLDAAVERVVEARSAFRFTTRRKDEGLASELEFLDARASLTRAQLSLSITETEALIRLAELEYAAGAGIAPDAVPSPENDR